MSYPYGLDTISDSQLYCVYDIEGVFVYFIRTNSFHSSIHTSKINRIKLYFYRFAFGYFQAYLKYAKG